MDSIYREAFERNYGIFSGEEQEKIRKGRIALIGCGGTGGITAVELVRSGVENIILYDDDVYTESNLNRQIACYIDTLGKKKVTVVADEIRRINPSCSVEIHDCKFSLDEAKDLIDRCDIIMPAADDWPLSMTVLAMAKDYKKPAILTYPVGAFCRVATFLPGSPYAQECLVIPNNLPYDKLVEFMCAPQNRAIMHLYMTKGGWTQEWFESWVNGEKPHAQLCSVVWESASLATMEIIKLLSGKWKPVVAPKYWEVTPTSTKIGNFSITRRLLARIIQKPGAEKMIAWFAKRPKLISAFTKAISR